jgi:hypothetical protein
MSLLKVQHGLLLVKSIESTLSEILVHIFALVRAPNLISLQSLVESTRHVLILKDSKLELEEFGNFLKLLRKELMLRNQLWVNNPMAILQIITNMVDI